MKSKEKTTKYKNIKNILKKIIKKATIILSIIVMNTFTFIGTSGAVNVKKIEIKKEGECGELITYRGKIIKTDYIYHEKNGRKYPAYCLEKAEYGISANLTETVISEGNIHDIKLWKYIINGYPYKTYQELGCKNKEEAYSATKQAIQICLYKNRIEDYKPIGEAGKRTIEAIKKITDSAEKSKEEQKPSSVNIKSINENFEQDNIQQEYLSKTYEINTNANYSKYNASVERIKAIIPEGIKITDINNNEKAEFASKEKFKILIPINHINQETEFKIKINTKIETKPVLYGKTANSANENYALTSAVYENIEEIMLDTYLKNTTSLKILKRDKETHKKLNYVEFEVLDKNKQTIYTNLKTNADGEITLNNILPGTYYIRETKAKYGYIKHSELTKIEIKLNEKAIIEFENIKKSKPNITINEKEIKVSYEEEEKQKENINKEKSTIIKKLPVTGM